MHALIESHQVAGMLLLGVAVVTGGCGKSKPAIGKSGEHLIAARQAIDAGDTAGALTSLTASLEAQPNEWAYLERARLYHAQGDLDAARADCEAGLELQPESRDLKWFLGELNKPEDKRFRGRNKQPPSASK